MISLEDELATTGADAAALAAERREVFSLFGELRAASYLAVALVTTGVGLVIKNNADRIGPVTIVAALVIAAAGCYAYALRARAPLPARGERVALSAAKRRVRGATGTIVADYVLLLGALLVSAAVGYAEAQFHLLGPNWPRHFLILALFHIATAYLTDSRLVLTAGLTALAGWFNTLEMSFGTRALLCAAVVALFRLVNRHKPFHAAYEHFAANLAFFGALSWAFDDKMRWIGVGMALALAAIVVWRGLRGGGEAMVIYAIIYATIAFDVAVLDVIHDDALRFFYLLVSTPIAIVILFLVYRRLKEQRA